MKIRLYHLNNIDTLMFQKIRNEIDEEINKKNDNYISKVNEMEYATYLSNKYLINFPVIHQNKVTVSKREEDIHGRLFPFDFVVDQEKYYKKRVISYIIPYTGNIKYLQYLPSKIYNSCIGSEIEERFEEIFIDIIDFYEQANLIKKQYDSELKNVFSNYDNLKNECESFNSGLIDHILSKLKYRKQTINRSLEFMNSLGVPLKKNEDTPETFSIPNPILRKKIIVEPTIESTKKIEPALNISIYNEILKTINDIGKNFERMPSLYKDKDEESLRDHILMIVDPNFQLGNATGETFNKNGKTDIALIYDGNIVFIAECKFWKGEKQYLKSIDQLLGYLTWRNSKTALIVFVRNSDISNVLSTIKTCTKKHKNFLSEEKASGESLFNYTLHLNDDEKREINMAVMVYHIPK